MDLEPELEAAGTAREKIREAFADRLPSPLLHDLTVVVTELVGNSVEHGPGEHIQVRLKVTDEGVVRGEIEDQGKGEVAIRDMAEDPEDGLGLRIVDWLTDRWAAYDGSTHIWFEMGAREPGDLEPEPVDPV